MKLTQILEADRKISLESAEIFEKKLNKNKKRKTLYDYETRKDEVFQNQQVKSSIDFDGEYSSSIRSVAIKKSQKINLTTRFLNGKMLMFSKISVKSFVCHLIDASMFPNYETQKIYDKYKINQCYLDQNLTDTDSTSMFFLFICDLQCNLREDKVRDIIFETMLKRKIFDGLDIWADYFEQFNCINQNLKKRVGLFEVENIDKSNIITIALNPKECCEKLNDYSDKKKHKGLKKSTPDMDVDSYSSCLADLTEYYDQFCRPFSKKIQQKRFQIINESMRKRSML